MAVVSWRLLRRGGRRLGWGAADQGMSSLTNFLLSVYVARTLGAVAFGAFSLAYVTYAFALNASRGLCHRPFRGQVQRHGPADLAARRRRLYGHRANRGPRRGACATWQGDCSAARPGWPLSPWTNAAGLLLQDSWRYSFFAQGRGHRAFINDTVWAAVLIPLAGVPADKRSRECVLARLRVGHGGRRRGRDRPAAGQGCAQPGARLGMADRDT